MTALVGIVHIGPAAFRDIGKLTELNVLAIWTIRTTQTIGLHAVSLTLLTTLIGKVLFVLRLSTEVR